MTSALLFVALLVVVDLSYRRWMRRSIAKRMIARREAAATPNEIVLDAPDAAVIRLPDRADASHDARRRG